MFSRHRVYRGARFRLRDLAYAPYDRRGDSQKMFSPDSGRALYLPVWRLTPCCH
jgi:hypothetical protein